MQEEKQEKQKKEENSGNLVRERKIEFVPDYEISDFCYEFIEKVSGIEPVFISNESSLYDFEPDIEPSPDNIEEYWFSKIYEKYDIDLYSVREELDNLNIAKICGELEKRLEWEKFCK